MKRLAWLAAWAGVLLGLTSCADEVDSVYANFRASFNFSPVTAVVPLNTAVNNAGEFCRVWKQSDSYYFDNAAGQSQTYPILATDAYTTWQTLSGFIVGTTNIPDIGTGQLTLVAYDLACPNCFTESTITRRLDFDGGGLSVVAAATGLTTSTISVS